MVVDDEPLVRSSLSELLTLEGYTVSTANSGKEALSLLKDYTADIIITDVKMPEMDGFQLLKEIRQGQDNTPVILITSYGSIESAVEAMREGAYDYITKPIVDAEIKLIIERLLKNNQLQEENERLRKELSAVKRDCFLDIIGKDVKMQKIYSLIEAISATRATVLIYGESGTGKRLVAHAIHRYNDPRKEKPFVEVSCGALSETLLESELFGHIKGAFTGAIRDRVGRFGLADGGTIFLDEIDAFSPALQVKLLRVLQEGEFEMVGDTSTKKVDIRIIAATNQNLQDLISQGRFRNDLYYRLNIISIEVPPLRERKPDIPPLVDAFIDKHSKHTNKKINGVSDSALQCLMDYAWPGNVRELENVIERAVILSRSPKIEKTDLPEFVAALRQNNIAKDIDGLNLKDSLINPEKELILKTLESADWNRNETASRLGINRTTLYKKMRKFELFKSKKG